MQYIIQYFRQLFCKHDLEFDEININQHSEFSSIVNQRVKVYCRCDKCGYHTSHWKY